MRKALVLIVIAAMAATLLPAVPAAAHSNFWGGVAIGLGSAFVLGSLFYPRPYAYPPTYTYPPPPPPTYYYPPPAYYYPPSGRIGYPPPLPPAPSRIPYRDNWVPGHWEERPGPYGETERIWVPGYWEERN
jgi:hypothetical protein